MKDFLCLPDHFYSVTWSQIVTKVQLPCFCIRWNDKDTSQAPWIQHTNSTLAAHVTPSFRFCQGYLQWQWEGNFFFLPCHTWLFISAGTWAEGLEGRRQNGAHKAPIVHWLMHWLITSQDFCIKAEEGFVREFGLIRKIWIVVFWAWFLREWLQQSVSRNIKMDHFSDRTTACV